MNKKVAKYVRRLATTRKPMIRGRPVIHSNRRISELVPARFPNLLKKDAILGGFNPSYAQDIIGMQWLGEELVSQAIEALRHPNFRYEL